MQGAQPAQRAQFVQSLEAMVESQDQEDTDEVTEHEYISYKEMVVAMMEFWGSSVPSDENMTAESPPSARSACREPVATKDMSDSLPLASLVSASLKCKHFEMVGTEEAALEGNIAYPVSSSFKAGKFTKPPSFKTRFYKIQGSPIAPTAGALDHEFSSLWGYHSCREPQTCVIDTKTVASLETSSRRCLSVLSHSDWFSLAVGNVIDVLGKRLPESDNEGRQWATPVRVCRSRQ
jgi:hypothetical protein